MKKLIQFIEDLKSSEIKPVVDQRLKEFSSIPRDFNNLFRELAYCILTAGTSAELGIKTINHLGEILFSGSEAEIQEKLKEVYRFHTVRAEYLYRAREAFKKLDVNHKEIRQHLVQNIKGLGMKESSHFLRNIGFSDYAIIDFHIVDILADNGLIERPKTMASNKYLEIESVLRELANATNTSLGELDLYLWYIETGKILK